MEILKQKVKRGRDQRENAFRKTKKTDFGVENRNDSVLGEKTRQIWGLKFGRFSKNICKVLIAVPRVQEILLICRVVIYRPE